MEPATVLFVAQYLNHLHHCVPQRYIILSINIVIIQHIYLYLSFFLSLKLGTSGNEILFHCRLDQHKINSVWR
jgi:hypothetical protein